MQEHLPMVQAKDEFLSLLAKHQVVIVVGETGCGKTTQIPQILDETGYTQGKKIMITQPRRLAALRVAERVASECGETVGHRVGYRVRFEAHETEATRILFATDGILWHALERDPELSEYSVIVVDEVHERSKFTDFTLGFLKTLLQRHPEKKVVLSSATMDPAVFTRFFEGAAVLNVPGRTFPVDIEYHPCWNPVIGAAREVDRIHNTMGRGDILVFCPGLSEIMRVIGLITRETHGVRALPLYGGMDPRIASEAFEPAAQRKVICATNVAETSLTIPGVKYVVDMGLERRPSWDAELGIDLLNLTPTSQASAKQRAGRAGRTEPGHCVRLYSEHDFQNREAHRTPPILCSDITGLALTAAVLPGAPRLDQLDLPTPVPEEIAHLAVNHLRAIGAIFPDTYYPTERGYKMAKLPLEPIYANMILIAVEEKCVREAALIAAFLSVRDVFYRTDKDHPMFEALPPGRLHPTSDLFSFLNIWETFISLTDNPEMWCSRYGLDARIMYNIRDGADQIISRLQHIGIGPFALEELRLKNPQGVLRTLVRAFPQSLCEFAGSLTYRTSRFRGIRIAADSVIASRLPEWFVGTDFVKVHGPRKHILARGNTEIPAELVRELAPERFTAAESSRPTEVMPVESTEGGNGRAAQIVTESKKRARMPRLRGTLFVERAGRTRVLRIDVRLGFAAVGATQLTVSSAGDILLQPWKMPVSMLAFGAETQKTLTQKGIGVLAELPRRRSALRELKLPESVETEIGVKLFDLGLISGAPDVRSETEQDEDGEDDEAGGAVSAPDIDADSVSLLALRLKDAGLNRALVMKLAALGYFKVRDLVRATRRSFMKSLGSKGTGLQTVLDEAEINEISALLGRYGYVLSDREAEEMDILERISEKHATVDEETARKVLGDRDFEAFSAYQGSDNATDRMLIRNAIALRHTRLALTWANFSIPAARSRRDPAIEIDDLSQEGMIGLLRAITSFNPYSGLRFSTYATQWMRQAISRFVHNAGWVRIPVHRVEFINKVRKAISKLEKKLEREPTVLEIAQKLKFDQAIVRAAIDELLTIWRPIYLDYKFDSEGDADSDNVSDLHSIIPDPAADLELNLRKGALAIELQETLDRAPLLEVERQLLIKAFGLFGEDESALADIASELDVSPDMIAKRMGRAFKVLQCQEVWERFREYVKLSPFEQSRFQIQWRQIVEGLETYIEQDRSGWTTEGRLTALVQFFGAEFDSLKSQEDYRKPLRSVVALVLSYEADLSDPEIATHLACEEDEVPILVRYAYEKLKHRRRSGLLAELGADALVGADSVMRHWFSELDADGHTLLEEDGVDKARRALDKFAWRNPREREIFERRYQIGYGHEGSTLEELGQRFGLSRERIRQICKSVLSRLKLDASWKELEPYLRDAEDMSLVGSAGHPASEQAVLMDRAINHGQDDEETRFIYIGGLKAVELGRILNQFEWKNPRERRVFELYHGIGHIALTPREIADELGIAVSETRAILSELEERMREHWRWEQIKSRLAKPVDTETGARDSSAANTSAQTEPIDAESETEAEELPPTRAETAALLFRLEPMEVVRLAAAAYGVSEAAVLGAGLERTTALARQVAMYLLRTVGRLSYPFIGEVMNRDHTTVIYSCRVIEEKCRTNQRLRDEVERLRAHIETKMNWNESKADKKGGME